jgi:hypothetical protein
LYADSLIKDQIREALEAGNLERAAELMDKLRNPPITPPLVARINLLLSFTFLVALAWFAIPLTATAWAWWY